MFTLNHGRCKIILLLQVISYQHLQEIELNLILFLYRQA